MNDLDWLQSRIVFHLSKCTYSNNFPDKYILNTLMYFGGKLLKPGNWEIYNDWIDELLTFDMNIHTPFFQDLKYFRPT
jgi:hypothetical protein